MTDTSKKNISRVALATVLIALGGLLYLSFPQSLKRVPVDFVDNYPQQSVDVIPHSLTDLAKDIIPVEQEVISRFDPTGGHSPDTYPAITRFCDAGRVQTSWSSGVDTSRRYFSPDLNIELLVLTYNAGDWLILTRNGLGYCSPIDTESIGADLQSIDMLTAIQP